MSRFTEDLVLAKPGEPARSAGGLLADLGVYGKPREIQRVAVAEWLRENPMPSELVRWGLERKGLLDARESAA